MTDATHPARARPTFARREDLELFLATLGRYERGEIDAEAWRQFRLLNGNYGQRNEPDRSMLRAKFPQGVMTSAQLRAVADAAERWSRGFAHLTTRENFQLHYVATADVEPALRRLAEAGITSREACGNAVRNVTGCPHAGVAQDEVFDPTPYAEALTRHFLRTELAQTLPRKFKIAFEGCAGEDHVWLPINDLGFRARLGEVDGRTVRGFEVLAGGGTAILPTVARPLVAFLPAGDLLALTEAVLRVFHRLGDRKNRKANRMKFLIRALGWDRFRAEVEAELAAVRARGAPALPFDPEAPGAEGPPVWARPDAPSPEAVAHRARAAALRGPGLLPIIQEDRRDAPALAAFRRTNVRPQRQPGFAQVTVTLPLGDLTSAQLRIVADLAESYGDGAVRATPGQDLVLRWVRDEDVGRLFARLAAAGLARDGAGTAADVVSCPGAETCRLAVTTSRGVGRLIEEHLRARPELLAEAGDLDVKVSGCPNGCSQHHIATIGLQGSARKVDGKPLPQYFLLVGGGVAGGGLRFGRLAAKVPARRVPEAVERLLELYRSSRAAGERPRAFFARVELDRVKAALRDLAEIDGASATADDWVEPFTDEPFGAEADAA